MASFSITYRFFSSYLICTYTFLFILIIKEKEQARNMITAALRGLKESERTPNQTEQSVDLNDLSNFVEK